MFRNIILTCIIMLFVSFHNVLCQDYQISQKDKHFSIDKINVKVGDKIIFLNEDDFFHTIYAKESTINEFEIKKQNPGEKNEVLIKEPGNFIISCMVHPQMILNVQVNP